MRSPGWRAFPPYPRPHVRPVGEEAGWRPPSYRSGLSGRPLSGACRRKTSRTHAPTPRRSLWPPPPPSPELAASVFASLWLRESGPLTQRASSLLSRERGVASLPVRRPESVPESSRFRRTTLPGTASLPPAGASSRLRPAAAGAAWPAGRGGESGVGNPAPLQTPAPPGPCPTAPLVPPRLLPFLPFPTLYPFSPPPSPLSVPGPSCTHLGRLDEHPRSSLSPAPSQHSGCR